MIAYLRSQLSSVNININSSMTSIDQSIAQPIFFQHTAPILTPQNEESSNYQQSSSSYTLRPVGDNQSTNNNNSNNNRVYLSKPSSQAQSEVSIPAVKIEDIGLQPVKVKVSSQMSTLNKEDRLQKSREKSK